MLEDPAQWQGKGAYLNDAWKEKFFDANMFLYKCSEFLSKKGIDYSVERTKLKTQIEEFGEQAKILSEENLNGQELAVIMKQNQLKKKAQ